LRGVLVAWAFTPCSQRRYGSVELDLSYVRVLYTAQVATASTCEESHGAKCHDGDDDPNNERGLVAFFSGFASTELKGARLEGHALRRVARLNGAVYRHGGQRITPRLTKAGTMTRLGADFYASEALQSPAKKKGEK
jgi:hypothetical protein